MPRDFQRFDGFVSGELSPYVLGRSDLAKQRMGCTTLRNFMVDFRGGAMNRPGFQFVGFVPPAVVSLEGGLQVTYPTTARAIPFSFSQGANQSCALIFGDQVMAVAIDGALVTHTPIVITAATNTDPVTITATGNAYDLGDYVFISGMGGMTQLNNRVFLVTGAGDTLTLQTIWLVDVDATDYGTYTVNGTVAKIYSRVTPWAQENLLPDTPTGEPGLKYSQSADVMTVTHPLYPPHQIIRNDNNHWDINQVDFGTSVETPVLESPFDGTVPPDPDSGYNFFSGYHYLVTAISPNGTEESLPQAFPGYAVTANGGGGIIGTALPTMSIYPGTSVTVTWDPVPNVSGYNIYRTPEVAAPGGNDAAVPPLTSLYGLVGATLGNVFRDQNGQPDFSLTPPQQTELFQNGIISGASVDTGGSGYSPYQTNIDISTSTGTGALIYPLIESGVITGLIVARTGKNYANTDTLTATDLAGTGSGFTGSIAVAAPNNYPASCVFYQQRLFFAGSILDPDTIWATQIGNYSNMNVSVPVRDSDAITAAIAAGGANTSEQVNEIIHLVPMNIGLLALTPGSLYQISGGGPSTAITPAAIQAQPQAYMGSSGVRPIAVDSDLVYNSARGNSVYAAAYNYFINIFAGTDLSFYSNHLFFGRYLTDWCYAEQPFKTIWAVRDDGILLSCAYLHAQEVYGWARHDTYGEAMSCCSIPEGDENSVYVINMRFLMGQQVPCVERMYSRYMGENPAGNVPAEPENAHFLDCGGILGKTEPDAQITLTGGAVDPNTGTYSGDAIQIFANDTVFEFTQLGDVIRCGGGVGTVTVVTDNQRITADFTGVSGPGRPISALIPNSGTLPDQYGNPMPSAVIPYPFNSGDWSIDTPVTRIQGLDQLEGLSVSALANGDVVYNLAVTDGAVTLPNRVTTACVGLGYQAQLQTHRLQSDQEVYEGRQKQVPNMDILIFQTRGLKAGSTFQSVTPIKDRPGGFQPNNAPVPLNDGYQTFNSDVNWTIDGYMCFQVDDPLPCTVQVVVAESLIGTTT